MNIQINHFKKTYKQTTIEIEHLFLNQRVVVIKGENGTGKSTLLKGIASLIEYEGDIINLHTYSYLSEKIELPCAVLLSDFFNMFLCNGNYDHLLFNKLLIELKLREQLNKDISELSKGMTMKVQLLLMLSLDRELYILDEPLNGLDRESVEVLVKLIKNSKKSFLITSHMNESIISFSYLEVIL